MHLVCFVYSHDGNQPALLLNKQKLVSAISRLCLGIMGGRDAHNQICVIHSSQITLHHRARLIISEGCLFFPCFSICKPHVSCIVHWDDLSQWTRLNWKEIQVWGRSCEWLLIKSKDRLWTDRFSGFISRITVVLVMRHISVCLWKSSHRVNFPEM